MSVLDWLECVPFGAMWVGVCVGLIYFIRSGSNGGER